MPAINFLSGCTVLCMSGVSLLLRDNSGKMQKNISISLAAGASIGGIAGKELFNFIYEFISRQRLFCVIQTVLLLSINIAVLLYFFFKTKVKHRNIEQPAVCVFVGLGLGVLSSFLGIGGGPFNIIILRLLFAMDTKKTYLNSLFIILCSQIIGLFYSVIKNNIPVFQLHTLLLMCAGGITGAVIGHLIYRKINIYSVERLFTWVLFFLIGINIYTLFTF